jgi:2Fe-2S ferredoxin
MAKITYIQSNGTTDEIDVPNGQSVKDGAINGFVPGILAQCGGACVCATCQVYVDDSWFETVGAAEGMEEDMLDFAFNPKRTSRLSCQIKVTDALDGLIVYVPEEQ